MVFYSNFMNLKIQSYFYVIFMFLGELDLDVRELIFVLYFMKC